MTTHGEIRVPEGRGARGKTLGAGGCPCTVTDACRLAVSRAYAGMIHGGAPPRHAFEAALVVLRWHHPRMTAAEAQRQLEGLLHMGTRH